MANNDKHTLAGEMPGNVVFGIQGESAYQVAVRNGFEGTEEEWLKSLNGPAGVSITDMYDLTASQSAAGTQSLSGKRHTLTVKLSDGTVRSFPFKDGDNGQRGRGVYPWDLNASSSFVDDEGITHYRDGVTLPDGVTLLDGDLLLTGDGDVYRVDAWNNIRGMTVTHLYNIAGSALGSGGNADQSGGFSQNLRVAMYNLLMDAVYQSSGHEADKEALAELLTGESGGGTVEPDEPDDPVITYYTIEKTLTNVSISNGAATVQAGTAYSATLTADEGYTLEEVTVTMGGEAVTVTDGVIDIASVTGNIVIVATATAESTGEGAWTSGTAFDLTGKIITGTTLDANGIETAKEAESCTDYVYCYGADYIYVRDCRVFLYFYDASKTFITRADVNSTEYEVPDNAVYLRISEVNTTYWPVVEGIVVMPVATTNNFTAGENAVTWEAGVIDTNTGEITSGSTVVSNFIAIGGATSTDVTASMATIAFYDGSQKFIGVWSNKVPSTLLACASYMRLKTWSNSKFDTITLA